MVEEVYEDEAEDDDDDEGAVIIAVVLLFVFALIMFFVSCVGVTFLISSSCKERARASCKSSSSLSLKT